MFSLSIFMHLNFGCDGIVLAFVALFVITLLDNSDVHCPDVMNFLLLQGSVVDVV